MRLGSRPKFFLDEIVALRFHLRTGESGLRKSAQGDIPVKAEPVNCEPWSNPKAKSAQTARVGSVVRSIAVETLSIQLFV